MKFSFKRLSNSELTYTPGHLLSILGLKLSAAESGWNTRTISVSLYTTELEVPIAHWDTHEIEFHREFHLGLDISSSHQRWHHIVQKTAGALQPEQSGLQRPARWKSVWKIILRRSSRSSLPQSCCIKELLRDAFTLPLNEHCLKQESPFALFIFSFPKVRLDPWSSPLTIRGRPTSALSVAFERYTDGGVTLNLVTVLTVNLGDSDEMSQV